jgi:vacuolar-type H+-ATPase catalytic subunit A/Vma1
MLKVILHLYEKGISALERGISVEKLSRMKVLEKIARAKYTKEDKLNEIDRIVEEIDKEIEVKDKG